MAADKHVIYLKLHRSKLKVGISLTLLIAALFTIIFLGFYKVTEGAETGKPIASDRLYPAKVDLDNNGKIEVLTYTSRHLVEQNFNKKSVRYEGVLDTNIIQLIDPISGKEYWNYSKIGINHVISYINQANYWERINSTESRLLFVQIAEVTPEANRYKRFNEGENQYDCTYIKNETGKYYTELLELLPDKTGYNVIPINITNRVTQVIPLNYDPGDDYPDFLVISTNLTYQFTWDFQFYNYSGDFFFQISSVYANGTIQWNVNNTQNNSYFLEWDKRNWFEPTAFSINQTHFVIKMTSGNIICASIKNGSTTWNTNSTNLYASEILDTTYDLDKDGYKEILVLTNDNNKSIFQYIYSKNGTNATSLMKKDFSEYITFTLVKANRAFGFDYDLLLVGRANSSILEAYNSTDSGLEMIWKINLTQSNPATQVDFHFSLEHYYEVKGNFYSEVRFHFSNNTEQDLILNITSGKTIIYLEHASESSIIADVIQDRENALEYIVLRNEQGIMSLSLSGPKILFTLSMFNEIMFYGAITIATAAGILFFIFYKSSIKIKNIKDQIVQKEKIKEYRRKIKETKKRDKKAKKNKKGNKTLQDESQDQKDIEKKNEDINPRNINLDQNEKLVKQDQEMQDNKDTEEKLDEKYLQKIAKSKNTTKGLRSISFIMLTIILFATILFITYVIILNTNITIYNSGDFIGIRNAYITITITIASVPLISVLYDMYAPSSAMLYVKIQQFFYNTFYKKKKDYKILILDMNHYAEKFSPVLVLTRSLFPIFISLTLGLTIFQSFSTQQIQTTGSDQMNILWLAEFEFFGGIVFILSYFFLIFIAPGAWLLDDAGVVYFEEPKDLHHPGDIDKISDWLQKFLKGIFGFTALLNYYRLFANFNILAMAQNESNPIMGFFQIFMIIILVILSPILYGMLVMFTSNADMIDDIEYNSQRLYNKLKKAGHDITPRRLRTIFEAQINPELS
ncbi:MAG: hypothetical protein ACTSXU_15665 [Promethearchaeota archaeon]